MYSGLEQILYEALHSTGQLSQISCLLLTPDTSPNRAAVDPDFILLVYLQGSIFAEFDQVEDAENFVKKGGIQFNGQDLLIEWK